MMFGAEASINSSNRNHLLETKIMDATTVLQYYTVPYLLPLAEFAVEARAGDVEGGLDRDLFFVDRVVVKILHNAMARMVWSTLRGTMNPQGQAGR